MIKHLINRPIAVSMCLIAIVTVALVSLRLIPVSLMPDIDIPQITIQVAWPGAPVREVDSRLLRPLRNQLMQVNSLDDIRSEAKTDAGSIYMSFEAGSDIDLIFIEVNEKIDRAMASMPEGVDRPKVLKASATDIPAFYLDISLKNESARGLDSLPRAGVAFTQLCDFARNIVVKRIEQLPQTAMVDISGVVGGELLCIPDYRKMEVMGVTPDILERAIRSGNANLGVLSIAEGLYHYNIYFDNQLATKEDIENLIINHEGRLYRFRDLCQVIERPARRKGMVRNGRSNAVSLAVIKQNDAQMKDLQESIGQLVKDLEKNYPDIRFELTRDQTQLLSYSIRNLESNLLLGAILACLVLFLFMRNIRLPLLIIITVPLSLILTLLCFHLIGITLNIISLSGLILGVGMMVDNSIIVIDNISQKWRRVSDLQEAVSLAVAEVFTPMLSSVLTTCSVFIPLIFLSGTAGALFFDQAMAVTIGLFASLLVSVLVIPVYFHLFFKRKTAVEPTRILGREVHALSLLRPYEKTFNWVFRHVPVVLCGLLLCLLLSWPVFKSVDKRSMPYIEYEDALMTIDWNSGITVEENDRRCDELLSVVRPLLTTSTTMVGVQDYLLSHTPEITASEAVVYLKATSAETLLEAESALERYMTAHYPQAVAAFSVSGNIFDMIFSTDEPDLEIQLQARGGGQLTVDEVRYFLDTLSARFPGLYVPPVVSESNIRYEVDLETMAYYGLTYGSISSRLQERVNSRDLYSISRGGYQLPVTLGEGRLQSEELLQTTIKTSDGVEIPLSYLIRESKGEDFKKLYSGRGGDYYPVRLNLHARDARSVMAFVDEYVREDTAYDVSYDGEYFSSRRLIKELMLVLLVAVGLLFFILAAQFESLAQPVIILSEIVIDLFFVLLGLWLLGESVNLMSLIGMVVMSGIVINDSILKVDTINRNRRRGQPLLRAILSAGHSRLTPIVMTTLTTVLAIAPLLYRVDMGSALQFPLSLTIIIGMLFGTLVSLFVVPMIYYIIYRKRK